MKYDPFSGLHRSDMGPAVAHYYGDLTRVLFIVIAILVGVSIPLSGDVESAILLGGPAIIMLVVLAGLTNPHGKTILILNAVAAGMGVLASETLAVVAYTQNQLALSSRFSWLRSFVLLLP